MMKMALRRSSRGREDTVHSKAQPLAHLCSILKEKNLFHIPSIEEVHLGHTAITGLSTLAITRNTPLGVRVNVVYRCLFDVTFNHSEVLKQI